MSHQRQRPAKTRRAECDASLGEVEGESHQPAHSLPVLSAHRGMLRRPTPGEVKNESSLISCSSKPLRATRSQ